ncbi:4-hydroxy-3-methylbut-2-enyl diphosphate reductase [Gammaproteobacteria bacterium]|nr:4-hydroxy-3-methylbut-2-enyl diphosphate reductase [Gammaproteobacteria bacterium]
MRQVLLANPRGFCAGVDRAIDIVEQALKKHGAPIYIRHEVVHNRNVVEDLKSKGAIFVERLREVPEGSIVIFSAHGVAKTVWKKADDLNLTVYDATCPLVTKVHKEVIRKQNQNTQVVLIGHTGHPEVEGTLGQSIDGKEVLLVEDEKDIAKIGLKDGQKISYTTQTTLSVDDTQHIVTELKKHFPDIDSPKKDDICYATQNRQDAVKQIINQAEVLIVLGSKNSSNSNRLKEIAEKNHVDAYLIDHYSELKDEWLENKETIGVTAGASAPEILVQEVIEYLKSLGISKVTEVTGAKEDVYFPPPKELRN